MKFSEIKNELRNEFDPLAQKLHLDEFYERDWSNTGFSIAYASGAVGLELDVDLSNFFIYALIFKPMGKEIPVGYEDEAGCRQKIYVQEALKELGVNISNVTRELQHLAGNYHNCTEMLEILKNLIEKNWDTLVSEHHRWFK